MNTLESTSPSLELGNPDRLSRYLERHIEGFEGSFELIKFDAGQSNPTYRISSASGNYVLRSMPPGQLLKSAHAIDREFRVLRALEPTDLPVPKVYTYCEDEGVIGSQFFVMEFLDGRVVGDPSLPGFSRSERKMAYDDFIQSLACLHSIDYKSIGLEDFGRSHDYFARQIRTWEKQYRASETAHIENMEALISWLKSNIPDDNGTELVSIVHGDFRFENTIFHATEPKLIGILDWELSTIGHPHSDVAYDCMLLRLPPANRGVRGLQGLSRSDLGIPTEEEYLATYCRLMGITEIPNWTFCLAFNFFRLAAICQGIKKRALQGNASSSRPGDVSNQVQLLAEMGRELGSRDNMMFWLGCRYE